MAFTKKTPQEIIDRILWLCERKDRRDFFGFEIADLVEFLTPKEVKLHLAQQFQLERDAFWEPKDTDFDSVVALVRNYLPFAWDKANNCRGLSADRSLRHMSAWLWLIGLDEKIEGLQEHTYYGKPQLVAICELPEIDVDWKVLDDGAWKTDSSDTGISAEEVLGR